jgi:phosphoribosylformylglycinamidine (FGAM) synthase-like amidotransferase family enzyme
VKRQFSSLLEAERARFQQSRKMLEVLNQVNLFFDAVGEDKQVEIVIRISQGDYLGLKKIIKDRKR